MASQPTRANAIAQQQTIYSQKTIINKLIQLLYMLKFEVMRFLVFEV